MAGDLLNATSRARTGGSGFTFFKWDGQAIAFCNSISHQTGRPVAAPTPIHPLDETYAVEIITPRAMGPGTVTLEFFELYGQRAWDRLTHLTGAVDLVDIFDRVANTAQPITMVKYIKPPKLRGKTMQPYTEEYHNCVVADVEDGENIDVSTMQVLKRVSVMYTHVTRGGKNPFSGGSQVSLPSDVRDSQSLNFG